MYFKLMISIFKIIVKTENKFSFNFNDETDFDNNFNKIEKLKQTFI